MTHTAKDMGEYARAETAGRRPSGAKRGEDSVEPLSLDEARRMRGSGWEGDLNEMRGPDGGS